MFIVRVNDDVIDGTVISNQAFVSAPASAVLDRPSDDPRTAVADDPTRDLVGDLPFLFAVKTAALQVDALSPGIVDPGDVLRYTIQIYNNGRLPATEVLLRDFVPAEHDLRRRHADVELPAGRQTRRRRVAARRGCSSELGRPYAAAAWSRPRRADGRRVGNRAVRSARQRRRGARHADHEPGRGLHGGAAEPADRRRRQSCDGTRADGRRRRRRAAVAHHEERRRRRRRPGARGRDARVRRASDQHRRRAGVQRRGPRRPRRDSGPSHLRRRLGDAQRRGERRRRRRRLAHGQLLDRLWAARAGSHDDVPVPRHAVPGSSHRYARDEHGNGLLERSDAAGERQRVDRRRRHPRRRLDQWARLARRRLRPCLRRQRDRARRLGRRAVLQRFAGARRAHGGRRRLPHERRHAELRDCRSPTSCASAGPAPARARRCSAARTPTSRTTCSASPKSSCCRAAICRT